MAQIFEVLMLICFGISWPISVVKSIKSKSAKGKSLVFTAVIIVGYICGIASKIAAGHLTYVLWLYVFNLVAVTLDMAISIVNKRKRLLTEMILLGIVNGCLLWKNALRLRIIYCPKTA